MVNISLEKKLQKLSNRFQIYCTFSPVNENLLDVYDIDKYGDVIVGSLRRYRAMTLQKAIVKAYALEFENKLVS